MFVWLYSHSLPYLEMCTDHVNNTPILLTIVNNMSILFLWFYGYIFTNYYIWKWAPWKTLFQYCQQQSISSLFFLSFPPWFSRYICITCYIWKCAQTHKQYTNIVNNSVKVPILFLFFSHQFCDYMCTNYHIWKWAQAM